MKTNTTALERPLIFGDTEQLQELKWHHANESFLDHMLTSWELLAKCKQLKEELHPEVKRSILKSNS
jgi:hypothetical protein